MPTPLTDSDKVLRNDTGKDMVTQLTAIAQALGVGVDADQINYDNTESGLTADDVQEAIDEVVSNKMDKANPTGTGSLSLNRKANTTKGENSVAVGLNCEASGARAFAEGNNCIASGIDSHAEGGATTASNTYCHAEGYNTIASGIRSHAEGSGTTASGDYSHAEGIATIASGVRSHAEGSATVASGARSHAEGNGATASGDNAHAEGLGTVANHRAQHVFGEFNAADTSTAASSERGNYVEIVGNGSAGAGGGRNARTLDWSGNEVLAGDLTINGNTSVGTAISGTDISSQFTPETDVNISSVQKFGKIIIITGATAKVTTANSFFNIGTFATGYRPTKTFTCALTNSATADFGYGSGLIGADGVVKGIYSKVTTYGLYFSLIFVL